MSGPVPITTLQGRVIPLRGDDIDTDRIIPGRFLRVITFEGLEAHVFEDDIPSRAEQGDVHPFAVEGYRSASILVVNRNFGCGSSREHAPQALARWGITAVVGESFSEIFFGNSLAIGLPCVTASPESIAWIQAQAGPDTVAEAVLELTTLTLEYEGRSIPVAMPRTAQEAFTTGAWDATGLLLANAAEVEATAARLPYMHWGQVSNGAR
jgi:3-isopropylmalate/(R)-2-methylmalate dehydratase small subunit